MAVREMPILLQTGLEAGDATEAVQQLAGMLQRAGHVAEGYAAAVVAREATFPTGLPTEPAVALPHADPDHVVSSAMAVGVFRTPVIFREMGNPERPLQVRVVFLLAVKEKEEAAGLLRDLVLAFRDHARLARLKQAETVDIARAVLNDLLPQQPGE